MNPDAIPDVRSIFGRAYEITDLARRAAYLDEACAAVPALRAEVDELLALHSQADGFMKQPALVAADFTANYEPITEGPGTRIGAYKLLQQIGEGGMGTVFMAEQEEPVRRRVALKIIKPGMDSKQVVARFEAERQALSMMDHPNIAKVLDAGTTATGRPFFVMELVHGTPITEYCDANKLSPRERLALFIPVCQAIQHAHMKGIIHRDIKPSNVMVTMYDDKPVPKVIDFGVAKAVEQRLTEKTMFTQYGSLVGTFEYMSPEQAEMNAFGVDTRSDVYSLGVLLYELLTGTTPLERQRLRTAALGEVVRLIKEEEAPRPSLRISSSDTLAKVAAARRTEPGKLSALVRGELDWIVMRCLEKDRTRRYDTAVGLAKDVERFLKDEAVEACPPTLGYRLQKAYRKNRIAVRVGSVFVCLALGAAAMGAVLAVRATNAERAAANAAAEANQQRDAAVAAEKIAEHAKDNALASREDLRRSLYASDMQLASTFWQEHDRGRTRELLKRQRPQPNEPDLRGFEWHYLNRECESASRTLALPVGSKQFTPDGSRVIVAMSADRQTDGKTGCSYREWDLKSGRELAEYNPYPGEDITSVYSPEFSNNGKRMVVSANVRNWDGQEQFWRKVVDVETRRDLLVLPPSDEVTFRSDITLLDGEGQRVIEAKRLNSGQLENSISLWDVDQKKRIRTIAHDVSKSEHFTWSVSLHPNGKRFAAIVRVVQPKPSADSYELRIWDLDTGKEVSRSPAEQKKPLQRLQYSPNGEYLARVSSNRNAIELRDPETGQVQHELTNVAGVQFDFSNDLTFSPDGARLAVHDFDRIGVPIWDLSAKQLKVKVNRTPLRILAAENTIRNLAFSDDNRSITLAASFQAGGGRNVSTYDLTDRNLVVAGPDGAPETTSFEVTNAYATSRFAAVWHRRDGDRRFCEIKVWDTTGRILFKVAHDFSPPAFDRRPWYHLRLSRDGTRLFRSETYSHPTDSTQDRNSVRVWNVNSGIELFHRERTEAGSFKVHDIHSDGQRLLTERQFTSTSSGSFKIKSRLSIWNLATDREEHGIDIEGSVNYARLNADGSQIAWCYLLRRPWSSVLSVWDTATGREVSRRSDWSGMEGPLTVGVPAFSPDGRTLVVSAGLSTGNSWNVYMLDPATCQNVRPPLLSKSGSLQDIRFSADGRRLFSSATTNLRDRVVEKRMVVWDLINGHELLNLPAKNGRCYEIDADFRRLHWANAIPGTADVEIVTWDGTPLAEPAK